MQSSEQPANPDPSGIAKAFSSLGASKGGKARANALSPERRREIARAAVEARWQKQGNLSIVHATHCGILKIGDLSLDCAVLETGERVISQRGVMTTLGIQKGGKQSAARKVDDGVLIPLFLAQKAVKPFIGDDLMKVLLNPIKYRDTRGGTMGFGMKAELIPQVCDVWLKARDAGVLKRVQQIRVAARADILMRGLAHVGILALVDEATGYQADRARDALTKILEAFIAKELRPWVRTFEPEFYQELFRLKGIEFKGTLKAPRFIGNLTNDLIYDRLAPGVREELNRINPSNEKGQRKHKNFQWLSQHVGYQKLKQHLASVTVLMKVFDDWETFKKKLDYALPRQDAAPLFDPPNE